MNCDEVPRGGPGLNSDVPDDYEFFFNGHIEVPNLKTDQCYEDGGACETGDGMYHGSDAMYQNGQGHPGAEAIYEDGFSVNQPKGEAKPTAKPQPQQSYARGPMPQRVAPSSTGYQGPQLLEPTETRVAKASRGSGFNRASYNSRSEAGALLPAGAVVPSEKPQSVGEGVQVFYPTMR
jgi:pilus assembly protein CpaC